MNAKKGTENRDLVICNTCLWSVSLLRGCQAIGYCPVCYGGKLEVIPVEDYEVYKLEINCKGGLSIEFADND